MPINQILPDGRVRIVNSKTGQTKDVAPEELGSYNPRLVTDYQEALQRKQSIENAAKAVSGGQLKIADIPTEQRTDVATSLSEMGYVPPEAAAEKKKSDSTKEILNFINNLEKQYSEAGGGTFGVGPGARIKGAIESGKGKLGLNEAANVYGDTSQGFAATLKSLTGDTGVLTDQDFERLAKLLPSLGSTRGESEQKFNLLRDQIAAKFGGDKTQTSFQPKVENNRGAITSLLDILFDPAVDLAEKSQKDLNRQLETGEYKTFYDLLFPKTSEDVGLFQDVAPAGISTGMTVSTLQGMGSGVKNLLSNLTGGGSKAVAAREAAAQGVKVDTKAILKAGDDYVANVDPAAQKAWETLKPSIKETTDLPELLKKITNWGDKSFTKSGDKRAITEGLLKAHLYGQGRNIIKEQAPEVAKLTTDIAKNISREEFTKKLPTIAATGAAGGIGAGLSGYLLYKLFGKQN